jgi:cytochrome c1
LSMANPELTSQQTRDVVAFIVTLRDNPKGPTQ